MKRLSSLVFWLLFHFAVDAQTSFLKDIQFAEHLQTINAYQETILFLDGISLEYLSEGQVDTISYHRGKVEYLRKNRFSSITHFKKISPSSSYWNASKFYSAIQYAYLGNYELTNEMLQSSKSLSPLFVELKNLELAGLALLLRDYEEYSSISNGWDDQYFQLQDHKDNINKTYQRLITRKKKSPVIAGLMSAIVPGSGKFYLGKVGQGTMSLVTTAIMGLQSYEGYRKDGLKSPNFIFFGSLFSVFYVANIWGSVVGVRIEQDQFNQTNNETILLHMHIPVRLLFK